MTIDWELVIVQAVTFTTTIGLIYLISIPSRRPPLTRANGQTTLYPPRSFLVLSIVCGLITLMFIIGLLLEGEWWWLWMIPIYGGFGYAAWAMARSYFNHRLTYDNFRVVVTDERGHSISVEWAKIDRVYTHPWSKNLILKTEAGKIIISPQLRGFVHFEAILRERGLYSN